MSEILKECGASGMGSFGWRGIVWKGQRGILLVACDFMGT